MANDTPENGNGHFDPKQLRSIHDIIQDLSKPIPQRFLEKKNKGGKDIFFISWHNATKLLDHYANGWNFEIRRIENFVQTSKVVYIVRINIPCIEGVVFREASGNEDESLDAFGDAFVNSESQALRRAAAKFGLGRDLYPTNFISEADHRKIYPKLYQKQQPAKTESAPKTEAANNAPQPQETRKPATDASRQEKTEKGGDKAPKMANPGQVNALAQYGKQKGQSEIDICLLYSKDRTEVFDQLYYDEAIEAIKALEKMPNAGGAK